MTDNRTTELRVKRLREMLNERGIEHYDHENGEPLRVLGKAEELATSWHFDGASYCAVPDGTGTFDIWIYHCTLYQAIAATLGRPKVKKVRGLTYDEHGGEVYYLACSGCGDWVDGDLDCIGENDVPNFCHNCGGEFDGPLLCRVCGELADMEFGDMCAECYWAEGEGNDER